MKKKNWYAVGIAAGLALGIGVVATIFQMVEVKEIIIPKQTVDYEIQKRLPYKHDVPFYDVYVTSVEFTGGDHTTINAQVRMVPDCKFSGFLKDKFCKHVEGFNASVSAITNLKYMAGKFYLQPVADNSITIATNFENELLEKHKDKIEKAFVPFLAKFLEDRPVYTVDSDSILRISLQNVSVDTDGNLLVKIDYKSIAMVILGWVGIGILILGFIILCFVCPEIFMIFGIFGLFS